MPYHLVLFLSKLILLKSTAYYIQYDNHKLEEYFVYYCVTVSPTYITYTHSDKHTTTN